MRKVLYLILFVLIGAGFNDASAQDVSVADVMADSVGAPSRSSFPGAPWAANEGDPRGVPTSWDWQGGSRPGYWMTPGDLKAISSWGHVYEWASGSPVKDVGIEVRNYKTYGFKKGGWQLLESIEKSGLGGGFFTETYSYSSKLPISRDGASRSFPTKAGFNSHFWLSPWPRNPNSGWQAYYSTFELRLKNGERNAKYLAVIGMDYWETINSSAGQRKPSIHISKHKFVTPEWRRWNLYVGGNNPPSSVQEYENIIRSIPLPPGVGAAVQRPIAVKGISLSSSREVIERGQRIQLGVSFEPSNASNRSVTWSTSDSSIVAVNATGQVMGQGFGTAFVTAKSVDGGFSKTAEIVVERSSSDGHQIVINAAGATGNENMALVVDGEVKQNWTVSRVDNEYWFTHKGQFSEVKVRFTNDFPSDNNLFVQSVKVDGVLYSANDPSFKEDAWGGSGCNGASGAALYCEGSIGWLVTLGDGATDPNSDPVDPVPAPVPSKPEATEDSSGTQRVVVTASGSTGNEKMALLVDGVEKQRWTVATSNKEYTYNQEGAFSEVKVAFVNDWPSSNNLFVEGVAVGGVSYSSNSPSFKEDAWGGSGCNGSSGAALYCEGTIGWLVNLSDGASDANIDSGSTPESSKPEVIVESSGSHEVVVRASGSTGDERMALLIDGVEKQSWKAATGISEYIHTQEGSFSEVKVAFANDRPSSNNLFVQGMTVDGVSYSSNRPDFKEDAWGGNGCNGSSGSGLYCEGAIGWLVNLSDDASGGNRELVLTSGSSLTGRDFFNSVVEWASRIEAESAIASNRESFEIETESDSDSAKVVYLSNASIGSRLVYSVDIPEPGIYTVKAHALGASKRAAVVAVGRQAVELTSDAPEGWEMLESKSFLHLRRAKRFRMTVYVLGDTEGFDYFELVKVEDGQLELSNLKKRKRLARRAKRLFKRISRRK